MRYSSLNAAKRWVIRADLKLSVLRAGSWRESGSEFHSIGPAKEKARRPSVLRQCHGTINWWLLADLRRWRLETSDVRVQQSIRYWGAFVLQTPVNCDSDFILNTLRWGMSSQCNTFFIRMRFNHRSSNAPASEMTYCVGWGVKLCTLTHSDENRGLNRINVKVITYQPNLRKCNWKCKQMHASFF